MKALYDTIGTTYATTRGEDPVIAADIERALSGASRVVNVGAGAGSYEPASCAVIAVEPSITMIQQRLPSAAPAVLGVAEALPFPDDSFDAAMAILTIHHWLDLAKGLSEMQRVAARVVLLTWDPAFEVGWFDDYFPQVVECGRDMPSLTDVTAQLSGFEIRPVDVPHDCRDGFMYAYWRRPEAYLDSNVRAGISAFAGVDIDDALRRLAADLESGAWAERYADVAARDSLDVGYRLIAADV